MHQENNVHAAQSSVSLEHANPIQFRLSPQQIIYFILVSKFKSWAFLSSYLFSLQTNQTTSSQQSLFIPKSYGYKFKDYLHIFPNSLLFKAGRSFTGKLLTLQELRNESEINLRSKSTKNYRTYKR